MKTYMFKNYSREDTVSSLIEKESSICIKGLLILLIVLGHNVILNYKIVDGSYTPVSSSFTPHRLLLYFFHVHCFFVLPIMYGYIYKHNSYKANIVDDIKKSFTRTMVPYFWFSLFFILLNYLRGFESSWGGYLWATIVGEQRLHSQYFDEHFLWFLPSMFAMMLWKSLYYNASKTWRYFIILFACVYLLWEFFVEMRIHVRIQNYVPFSLLRGLHYFALVMFVRTIIEKCNKYNLLYAIGAACICSAVLLKTSGQNVYFQCKVWVIYTFVMTTSVFIVIYQFRNKFKNKMLYIMGKYSLYIYLYHVMVYNIVNAILLHFFTRTYSLGGASFVITTFISIVLSILTEKFSLYKKLVFPTI